jgi:hypothetical protein
MVYRGPGFLSVVFGSSPTPFPLCRINKLSSQSFLFVFSRSRLLKDEGMGVCEEPNNTKARNPWPSVKLSILSGVKYGLFLLYKSRNPGNACTLS